MPTDLLRLETFLFSYTYGEGTYAVAVEGLCFSEARHRFATMPHAEKKARIIAPLAPQKGEGLKSARAAFAQLLRALRDHWLSRAKGVDATG